MATPLPQELRDMMAEIGPRWRSDISGHIRAMLEGFSMVLKDAPKEGVEVRRGIRYGDDPRQEYGLFLPAGPECNRPAVLFVHGGAFTEGHRNRTDEIYANTLYFLARHGIVGVNVGYRLAPQACFPEATRDIAAVVRAVRDTAPAIGVDPQRVFLMGHSAGAAHVASYAYDGSLQPETGSGLAGLIVVSGRVRVENRPDNPNARRVEAYYQTADPAELDRLSPVSHVGPDSIPTFVALGRIRKSADRRALRRTRVQARAGQGTLPARRYGCAVTTTHRRSPTSTPRRTCWDRRCSILSPSLADSARMDMYRVMSHRRRNLILRVRSKWKSTLPSFLLPICTGF
jgi:acetyl esterase